MNQNSKLRLGSFNFIKGIAICIVVFGHVASDFNIEKLALFYPIFLILDLLKTAVVPLFFVISGYGIVASRVQLTLKKTSKMLLVPYVMVMIAFCVLRPVRDFIQTGNFVQALNELKSVFLAFLLGIPIPGKVLFGYKLSHCAIVWFLLALFWSQNLVTWILKCKNIWVQLALVVACAALGQMLFRLDLIYFCIPQGLIATTYVYVGYLLKKYTVLEKRLPQKWMYLAWVIVSCVYAKVGIFDLCYGTFRSFWFDYFGVIFLTLLLLVIGIRLGSLEWRIFDIFKNAGIFSYWVLCIHSIEEKCLPWRSYIHFMEAFPNLGFLLALLIKGMIISVGCFWLKKVQRRKYRKRIKNYADK